MRCDKNFNCFGKLLSQLVFPQTGIPLERVHIINNCFKIVGCIMLLLTASESCKSVFRLFFLGFVMKNSLSCSRIRNIYLFVFLLMPGMRSSPNIFNFSAKNRFSCLSCHRILLNQNVRMQKDEYPSKCIEDQVNWNRAVRYSKINHHCLLELKFKR